MPSIKQQGQKFGTEATQGTDGKNDVQEEKCSGTIGANANAANIQVTAEMLRQGHETPDI